MNEQLDPGALPQARMTKRRWRYGIDDITEAFRRSRNHRRKFRRISKGELQVRSVGLHDRV